MRVACVLTCAAVSLLATAQTDSQRPDLSTKSQVRVTEAYFDGHTVKFTMAPLSEGQHHLVLGPYQMGPRLTPKKPSDRHQNVYLVSPGKEHHVDGWDDYDHNTVLSAVSKEGKQWEWDVYFAIVLDPQMKQDFQSEDQLIIAAQKRFRPGANFTFDEIPGKGFLRKFMKIDSMQGLAKFRKKNGALPQLLIVPAGLVVHATAVDQQQQAKK